MSQLDFAIRMVEKFYPLKPEQIEALPPSLEWRGIYRIRDAHAQVWLLRLLHLPQAVNSWTQTGHLLRWLEQQRYPAPRVCQTHDRQLVGQLEGWSSLLLTYIEGDVLDVHSPDFALLGYSLAQLHALPLPVLSTLSGLLPRSRCHPKLIQDNTARQLAAGYASLQTALRPWVMALRQSLDPLVNAAFERDLCLTHGDCWYNNAVKTAPDQIVLIDWDAAGLGIPILDVGYALLSAHYDPSQPLHIAADASKIQAILSGYQRVRPITSAERDLMESAVRFPLAFHLGRYFESNPGATDDHAELQKMRARFAATHEIAQLAIDYLGG